MTDCEEARLMLAWLRTEGIEVRVLTVGSVSIELSGPLGDHGGSRALSSVPRKTIYAEFGGDALEAAERDQTADDLSADEDD